MKIHQLFISNDKTNSKWIEIFKSQIQNHKNESIDEALTGENGDILLKVKAKKEYLTLSTTQIFYI